MYLEALNPVQKLSLRGLSSTKKIWSKIICHPKPSKPIIDSTKERNQSEILGVALSNFLLTRHISSDSIM